MLRLRSAYSKCGSYGIVADPSLSVVESLSVWVANLGGWGACNSPTTFTDTRYPTSRDVMQVNLAVIDTSSSGFIDSDWLQKKEFVKDIAASFAERNLFDNGGTASYVQFNGTEYTSGTFSSTQRYDAFVDGTLSATTGDANVAAGIAKGRQLLNAVPSAASFMIVVTDGKRGAAGDLKAEADAARAEGTTVFAVGVGEK